MQGVKGIALKKQTELFAWSNKLVKSKNLWERRLALVLLTHFVKDKNSRAQIDKTLATVRGDKEHYVKKAIEWLQRMATRHRQSLPRKVRKAEDATSANIAGQR